MNVVEQLAPAFALVFGVSFLLYSVFNLLFVISVNDKEREYINLDVSEVTDSNKVKLRWHIIVLLVLVDMMSCISFFTGAAFVACFAKDFL